MDNTNSPEYVLIKENIQNPTLSKNDLTKICTILDESSFSQNELMDLLITSLYSDYKEISNLLFPKIEDICCSRIQSVFIALCMQNDTDTVSLILEKGFIIDNTFHTQLQKMGSRINHDIIKMVRDVLLKRKIENLKININRDLT